MTDHRPLDTRQIKVAFIHIGKNAGTQIMFLAEQLQQHGICIEKLSHTTKLRNVVKDVPYFFSIRNPISRFYSGFYSRKRKGQPRLYVEWTSQEAAAFNRFDHANDLAEALFRSGQDGRDATEAISSIKHTAMQQIDWFEGQLNFRLRPPLWIIRQEHFDTDFGVLLRQLDLTIRLSDLQMAKDDKRAHRNDYTNIPPLSALAQSNLRQWYARDFAFYDLCSDWIETRLAGR